MALAQIDLSHLAERHGAAIRQRDQHWARDLFRAAGVVARVEGAHRIAFPTLDGGGHRLSAERRRLEPGIGWEGRSARA